MGILVNYGPIAMFLEAGNWVECRYCTQLGPNDAAGRPLCIKDGPLGTITTLDSRCSAFRREVGADDDRGRPFSFEEYDRGTGLERPAR